MVGNVPAKKNGSSVSSNSLFSTVPHPRGAAGSASTLRFFFFFCTRSREWVHGNQWRSWDPINPGALSIARKKTNIVYMMVNFNYIVGNSFFTLVHVHQGPIV